MKKHTFLFIGFALCTSYASLFSQDAAVPKREFGLQISGLNFDGFTPFSGIYKKQLAENKYRRISGTFGNLQLEGQNSTHNFSLSAGLSIGVEKRKSVGEKTLLYAGPEFNMGLSFSKASRFDAFWSISPGITYVLGIQYDFKEHWAVNLEGGPGASLSIRKFFGNDVSYNFSSGFSSNVALGLMHKF